MTADDSIARWRQAQAEREAARKARREMIESGTGREQLVPERQPTQSAVFGAPFPRVILGHENQRRK